MKVNVYNVESFVDEKLKIMVSDLIQNTKLKISVKISMVQGRRIFILWSVLFK